MRLFGKVNSAIDRFDRAGWVTPPFDLELSSVVVNTTVLSLVPSSLTDLSLDPDGLTDLTIDASAIADLTITPSNLPAR